MGDRNGVGWAFGLLAFVEFYERHFERAESLARGVAREADQRGDRWAVGMMDTLLAQLALWRGEVDESLRLAEQARAQFKRIGNEYGLAQALAPLMRAQIATGRSSAVQRTMEEMSSLAANGRNGLVPLLALAGAAMHRGAGRDALAAADRAITGLAEMGATQSEPFIVRALALLQTGDPEEAVVSIERLGRDGTGSQPFADAVEALVRACGGEHVRAHELAEAVIGCDVSTYLDDVFAGVAGASACAALGLADAASTYAETAVLRASGAGDVIATALSTAVYRAVTGRVHPAHDETTQLSEGWTTVLTLLRGL
jgi:hypothetical protein